MTITIEQPSYSMSQHSPYGLARLSARLITYVNVPSYMYDTQQAPLSCKYKCIPHKLQKTVLVEPEPSLYLLILTHFDQYCPATIPYPVSPPFPSSSSQ